jgi:DNA-binding transcriptional ArsR family regulator
MRLRLAGPDATPVAFGCSPGHEALRSLHVLGDVKHHPLHISWALRARARMSPGLREQAERYAFWYLDRPLVFRDIWQQDDLGSWPEELSVLRAAPVEQFAEQLVHGALLRRMIGRRISLEMFLRSTELRETALANVESRHAPSLPVLRELIDDPQRCRAAFADFLAAYWETCLAPDWPDLRERLREDIARRGRALSRRGLAWMLAELSPYVRVDPDTEDVVIAPPRSGRDVAPLDLSLTGTDQILLVPSHFVWPELVTVVQRDPLDGRDRTTVLVCYALAEMQREGRAPVPPEHLLKLLRSAGDATRLQVLQLLAQRPRSTRELAGLIGLTEAAISKHLKLLQDAGWVAPERRSYYVYYGLARDSLTDLSDGLAQMLG